MNFFEHQDQARRNTGRLVFFLVLAVSSLIVMTVVAVAAVVAFKSDAVYAADSSLIDIFKQAVSLELLLKVSAGVIAVVGLASLYKLAQLSGGGQAVAESMGGKLLNLSTQNPSERMILNVVEEMAIASGTPVPPVYLLEESGINAFAAGYKPQDAVIGVTRGCIELLNRDELQGVVAHEFSHILHGDMRLNIRLVGILHGILVIGLIGYFIFRSTAFTSHRRSSRNGGGIAMGVFALGAALMAIGYAGTFFGKLIKAAVSRQREYLADASAVQFSRNPDGITGALKKIGGFDKGSMLENENAAEFSHMYFGEGVPNFLSMLATHPPLEDRITRLDPKWKGGFSPTAAPSSAAAGSEQLSGFAGEQQYAGMAEHNDTGKYDTSDKAATGHPSSKSESVQSSAMASHSSPPTNPQASAIDSIGQPSDAHLSYAHSLIAALPQALREAAHDSFSARALVYNLLMSKDPVIADKQRQLIKENAHPVVCKHTFSLADSVRSLKAECRLPILEMSIPAIKAMSERQYGVFKRMIIMLIQADQKVELHEWAIYRIIQHNVEPVSHRSNTKSLGSLKSEVETLISALAHAGHLVNEEAFRAFNQARDLLPLGNLSLQRSEDINFPQLDKVVQQLSRLKPLQKPILLKAMAICVSHDGKVTAEEAELFRAVADSLDCPVPPLLPQQTLA